MRVGVDVIVGANDCPNLQLINAKLMTKVRMAKACFFLTMYHPAAISGAPGGY